MSGKERAYDRELRARGAKLGVRVQEEPPFCWFCPSEKGKQSNEHIFPNWLLDRLDAREEEFTPAHFDHEFRLISYRGPFSASSLVAGSVCTTCNSGWMSSLEVAFEAAIFQKSRRGEIPPADRRTIARWFAKMAIAINTSQNYRLLLPKKVRHSVRSGMPNHVSVFLGRVSDPPYKIQFAQGCHGVASIVGGLPMSWDAKAAVERIHAVAVLIDGLVGIIIYGPGVEARPRFPLKRIWPLTSDRITWGSLPRPTDWLQPLILEISVDTPRDGLKE